MSFARSLAVLVVLATPELGVAGETTTPPAPTISPPPPPPPRATQPSRPRAPEPQPDAPEQAEPSTPTPVDTRILVDAMLGMGSDNLNLGLGVRGGKTLDNHLYLGGLFTYHVGESAAGGSVSGFYLGPEAGYGIALAIAPVVIRPYLGLGFATASASTMAGSASKTEVSIWPGVAAHHRFADSSFVVGGDLRFVTGPWGTSLGLFVLGGMFFGS